MIAPGELGGGGTAMTVGVPSLELLVRPSAPVDEPRPAGPDVPLDDLTGEAPRA